MIKSKIRYLNIYIYELNKINNLMHYFYLMITDSKAKGCCWIPNHSIDFNLILYNQNDTIELDDFFCMSFICSDMLVNEIKKLSIPTYTSKNEHSQIFHV